VDERHEWINNHSYELWEKAGKPEGRSLEFWLKAENEHDHCCCGRLCVLASGDCPYQTEQPTTGGKHISVCRRNDGNCKHRAIYMNNR
jgi:hypothetical protein